LGTAKSALCGYGSSVYFPNPHANQKGMNSMNDFGTTPQAPAPSGGSGGLSFISAVIGGAIVAAVIAVLIATGVIGGKTGFTDIARKTFVGAAQRDGRRLVISMMYGLVKEGGPTYWDQAATLLDWGFAQDRSASIGLL